MKPWAGGAVEAPEEYPPIPNTPPLSSTFSLSAPAAPKLDIENGQLSTITPLLPNSAPLAPQRHSRASRWGPGIAPPLPHPGSSTWARGRSGHEVRPGETPPPVPGSTLVPPPSACSWGRRSRSSGPARESTWGRARRTAKGPARQPTKQAARPCEARAAGCRAVLAPSRRPARLTSTLRGSAESNNL